MVRSRLGRLRVGLPWAVALLLALVVLLPTATASEAASPTPWKTFYARQTKMADWAEWFLSDIYRSLNLKDAYAIRLDAQYLLPIARQEHAWVTSHKPQACYKAWWGYAHNFWSQVLVGARDEWQYAQMVGSILRVGGVEYVDRALIYLEKMRSHRPRC